MAPLAVKEIIEATGGRLLSVNSDSLEYEKKLFHRFRGVSIDSRTISGGEVFFALRGQRFNGHDFIKEALLKGDGAVIDSTCYPLPEVYTKWYISEGKIIICVEDTLKALQDLAHFLRARLNIPVIAITGSNGKTTTKEMTYAILSRRFKVIKNEGNLNNHIGLPLSLTRLSPNDEVIVLELGMNAPGEIRKLCDIAAPNHGIITNIGTAHIGKLGGLDSVRRAKFEILQGLTVIVLNADDSFLMQGYEAVRRQEGFNGRLITFSIQGFSNRVNNDFHVLAKDVYMTERGSNFILELSDGRSIPITLNVQGLFNVYNALAASAVCLSLEITVEEIKTALKDYKPFPMRFEVIKRNKMTLIDDSYNANPSSMEVALKELVRIGGKGRIVAVLGDMLELGEFSEKAHSDIVEMVSDMGVNVFVGVGEMMSSAAEKSKKMRGKKSLPEIYLFKDVNKASRDIMDILKDGDTVLVKGSRAMGMEKIIERMKV
jgi:UDP-N-acetylmuramoyl-tripeptide--D-alanyl-D-alanine ligase